MPDREVKTIRDLIFYQYAKIIAKSAMGSDAKKSAYGFIKTTFRSLRDDKKRWSDILREDKQLVDAEKKCVYCGAEDQLQWEHIVPKSLAINDRCATCDKIQGIHNQIWACKTCNTRKGTKGLYRFLKEKHPDAKPFSDIVPPLLEKNISRQFTSATNVTVHSMLLMNTMRLMSLSLTLRCNGFNTQYYF